MRCAVADLPLPPLRCPCHRHIFEGKRYVEEYRSADLESELGMGRDKLAALAQLLGGDYCEGVAGGWVSRAASWETVRLWEAHCWVQHGIAGFRRLSSTEQHRATEQHGAAASLPCRHSACHHPATLLLPAGVGIVNAVEIVNAFSGPNGLRQFRDWLASPDEQLLELARGGACASGKKPRKGRGSAKKQQKEQGQQQGGSQAEEAEVAGGDGQQEDEGEGEGEEDAAGDDGGGGSQQQEQQQQQQQERLVAEFKQRHRGVRRNWEPPPSVPSAAVDAAYASPKVDASKDK